MVNPSILAFYDKTPEESRLSSGPGLLEEFRTRELILRHIPHAPATVLDIGGGAGVYSFWLAERGYDVHLIDATPRLVEVAMRRNASATHPLRSMQVGDARALGDAAPPADAVLMLGPLYHLQELDARKAALREALRVLRAGGVLVAAGISRFASALDGLARELLTDPAFERIMSRDLTDGRHENDTNRLDYFTSAYFHHPHELRDEASGAGFHVDALYGIEGPGWMLPDIDARLRDPARREIVLRVARALESEPTTIGCSAHLLLVAHKP